MMDGFVHTVKEWSEMDSHIKQRYHFALSAFSRMYGVNKIDFNMKQFCEEWSHWEVNAPLDNTIDQYFYYEYKNWRGR